MQIFCQPARSDIAATVKLTTPMGKLATKNRQRPVMKTAPVECGDGLVNETAGEACDAGSELTDTCDYGLTECDVYFRVFVCRWSDDLLRRWDSRSQSRILRAR